MQQVTKISGIGAYAPKRIITNDYVLNLLEKKSSPYLDPNELPAFMNKARLKIEKAGNITRHWCDEDEYCTDIALKASHAALDDAGVQADEIDLIIFTGMSKAFVEPATSHVLRSDLKAKNANVIDTQDACTSFLKSIEMVDALIKTGVYKRVLIASGERSFDWANFTCKTVDELKWKLASCTIGDAAGAIILEATEESEYRDDDKHMRFFNKISVGDYSVCNIGLNHSVGDRYQLYSHSARLLHIGRKVMSNLVAEIFSRDSWKEFVFDKVLHHDVGSWVNNAIEEILGESDVKYRDGHEPYFPEYGNVASASLPLAMQIAKEKGRLKRGDNCLFACPAAGIQAGVMTFRY